jgi:hypothetical protein
MRWIKPLKFFAGIGHGEAQVDGGLGGIPIRFPGGDFALKRVLIRNPPIQALPL